MVNIVVEKHDKCFIFISTWGTKLFKLDGTEFGWKSVIDMYTRECARRAAGKARMVPRLRESYVMRDAWTKLNVAPAKIMQVHVCIHYFINIVVRYITWPVLIVTHAARACLD